MTDTEKWSKFARRTTAEMLLSYENFRRKGDVHELSERMLMCLLRNAVETEIITAREMAQIVVRMSADIQKEELDNEKSRLHLH